MINIKVYKDPWALEGITPPECPHCGRALNTSHTYSVCPKCANRFVYVNEYHPKDMDALCWLVKELGVPAFTSWGVFRKVMSTLTPEARKYAKWVAYNHKPYIGPLRYYRNYRYLVCKEPGQLISVTNVPSSYQDRVAYAYDLVRNAVYKKRIRPPKFLGDFSYTFEEWGVLNFGESFSHPQVRDAAERIWSNL